MRRIRFRLALIAWWAFLKVAPTDLVDFVTEALKGQRQ